MHRRIMLAGILICMCFIIPIQAELSEKISIYQTDFSTNPNWTTNNPTRYYWNSTNEMYHYFVEGGTGGYASVPVPHDENFSLLVLEYDIIPIRTDIDSAFRLDLTGTDMNINKGPSIISEFSNKRDLHAMWLRVITQNSNLKEVGSLTSAYPGETKTFEDNTTYHVTVRYNKDSGSSDIKIESNNTPVWGYFLSIDQELHFLDVLAITSVGDYGNIGHSAEGYIDNVDLYMYQQVEPTPAETTIPSTPVPSLTMVTTSVPPTPIPTTTQAASGLWIPVTAGLIIGLLSVLWRTGGKNH
jgi:hypothetical protein